MNVFKKHKALLDGSDFSSGVYFDVTPNWGADTLSRVDLITDFVKDKSVIHMGCCDHKPLIASKIKNNEWLHDRITKVATRCHGIDIDQETINYIQELGYKNVESGNILTDSFEVIESQKWDIMVFGEILEHIDNPVDFLHKIHKKYKGQIKEILITVPNGMSIEVFKGAFKSKEYINSDHRYWFTPYTLAKVLTHASYKPLNFTFAMYGKAFKIKGLKSYIYSRLFKKKIAFRESLVMLASF